MPLFSEETIRRVAEASDIVDIIGSYIPLKRAGASFRALCPFHNEKSPSFHVNPARQAFHCFGCKAGGGVIRFVMTYENLDFGAAVRKLAERAAITLVEETLTPEDQRRQDQRGRLLALHNEATDWFHHNLMRRPIGAPARDYLQRRGLTADIAREWRLGYAPDTFDAFLQWARGRGYSNDLLETSGLCKAKDTDHDRPGPRHIYDRFRHRVIFPICNDTGEPIAFSGRALSPDEQAKYLNSPETPIFTKGAVLFGLHKTKRAIIKEKRAIVCEGQIDLIMAHHAGVENIVAPQGTAFTEKQARILRRFADEAILCFDSDTAGQMAAERSLPALLAQGVTVRLADMPPGQDPDSLIRQNGPDAFRALIAAAPDFFDHQLQRQAGQHDLADARGRLAFARKMATLAAPVLEPILLDTIAHKVAARLGIPQADFLQLVTQERKTAPRPHAAPDTAPEPDLEPAPTPKPPRRPTQTILTLCALALRDPDSRQTLMEREWDTLLPDLPDGDLLAAVLTANLDIAHRPGSPAAWLATLDAPDEALLTPLLHAPLPPDPARVLHDCWRELESIPLRQRQSALQSRLRDPALPLEQILQIQKEILTLQKALQN